MKFSLNILFIISFLFQSFLFSQNKENGLISKPYKTLSGSDYYKYYFDLNPVDSSAFKYHVRIPVTSMVFDFWGNDSLQMSGNLYLYAWQHKYLYNRKGERIKELEKSMGYKIVSLPDSLVNSYMKLFFQSQILDLSLDSLAIMNTENNKSDCLDISFFVKMNQSVDLFKMICVYGESKNARFKSVFIQNYNNLEKIFKIEQFRNDLRESFSPNHETLQGNSIFINTSIFPKSYQRKLKRDYKKEQKNNSK